MKPSRRGWVTHTGLFALVFAVYMLIGRVVTAPVIMVMPGWVPFLPWLAVPYLLALVPRLARQPVPVDVATGAMLAVAFGLLFGMGRRRVPA